MAKAPNAANDDISSFSLPLSITQKTNIDQGGSVSRTERGKNLTEVTSGVIACILPVFVCVNDLRLGSGRSFRDTGLLYLFPEILRGPLRSDLGPGLLVQLRHQKGHIFCHKTLPHCATFRRITRRER